MWRRSFHLGTILAGFCTIFVAGGILVYLGFVSVSKQRVALEGIVERTYREHLSSLVRRIEEEVRSIEAGAMDDLRAQVKAGLWERFRSDHALDGVMDGVFLVNGDGELVSPSPGYDDVSSPAPWKDEEIGSLYTEGVGYELEEGRPDSALGVYRSALHRVSSPRSRAILLNAIGRCRYKLGDFEGALRTYETLYSLCGETAFSVCEDPVGLSLRAVAQDRIAACAERLGDNRRAVEASLALSGNVLDARAGVQREQRILFLSRARRRLTELGEVCPEARAGLEELLQMESEHLDRETLAKELTAYVLPHLGVEGPAKETGHLLYRTDGVPHRVVYTRAFDGGIMGFRTALGYVREGIERRILRDTTLPVSMVDGDATDASWVREELSHIALPWSLVVSSAEAAQMNALVHRQWIVYLCIISLAILGMGAGMLFTIRGVTREMEMARMRSEFVSNVSHELKTPLALIRMYGETLEMGRVSDEEARREYMSVITRESRRLGHLIDNVLDFSRIEAGKKTYSFELGDAGKVVRDTVEMYRLRLERRGFTLEMDVQDDLPACRMDREAMEQALLNLLSNAEKYSKTEKEIRVRAWSQDGAVVIEVTDRGIGIRPEDRERIFEKFQRVGDMTETGGAGLGLTLVRHIVDAHGGKVSLKSEVGKGSTFAVRIPVASL